MTTRSRSCLAVILAAGEGTRMRSSVPKVLHRIAGRTMLAHVVHTAEAAGVDALAVVIGPGRPDVEAEARAIAPGIEVVVQAERLGTAHAVLAAEPVLSSGYDDLLVLYADVPLVESTTLERMRAALRDGAGLAALGFEAADPKGYGRLLIAGEELIAIREDKDASPAERAVALCNSGLMALDGRRALALLRGIGRNNVQGEYYLTDAVGVARGEGLRCGVLFTSENEVMGINDRGQLATAEGLLQRRLRAAAMRAGVTLMAPETVFLSSDTVLEQDVTVEPNVVFGPGVTVCEGAVIHAFSHLEGATVAARASIGPFARLRPGTLVGTGARIGNFVETKNAAVGDGAKINHLSYIGDAAVGAAANIGAGAITCNYDGFSKSRTEVGANAFVGSNASLVAPVTIGAGAIVGAGSVITADVPDGALALGRSRQAVKEGWGERFRAARGRKA